MRNEDLKFTTALDYMEDMESDELWCQYRRTNIAEMRPYQLGETLEGVSISQPDLDNGSPKIGDMIARNPMNYDDQWLVSKEYFEENFEEV